MPAKQVECSGWHTRDEIEDSLLAAKTLEDFRYWLRISLAWPGAVVGFGATEKSAGEDAKKKAKAGASEFCRILRGCSQGQQECEFDNYKLTIQDAYPPESDAGDWLVTGVVKQVKCKCAAPAPPK